MLTKDGHLPPELWKIFLESLGLLRIHAENVHVGVEASI